MYNVITKWGIAEWSHKRKLVHSQELEISTEEFGVQIAFEQEVWGNKIVEAYLEKSEVGWGTV